MVARLYLVVAVLIQTLDDRAGGVESDEAKLVGRVDHQYVHAEAIEIDSVWLDVARYDPATQMLDESHVVLTSGVRLFPVVQRLIWPGEMDLMARIAGLRLKERWDDWDRSAYTGNVVSVYGR